MPKYLGKRRRSNAPASPPSYKRRKMTKVTRVRRSRRSVLQTGKMTYAKCRNVQIIDVEIPASLSVGYTEIRIPIAWQRPVGGLGGLPSYSYNILKANPYVSTGRFAQVYKAWKQWAIKGVKLEFTPRSNIATGDEVGVGAMYTTSGVQNLNTNAPKRISPDLMVEPAFKILNPRRPYKKYISCKKISKQAHLDWEDCTDFSLSTNYSDKILSEAWTMLIWDLSKEFETGSEALRLGTLKITWFVTFRGQESA